MIINDYLPHIHQYDTFKVYNISTHDTIVFNNDALYKVVKLIGIKRNTITFYI